MGQINNLCCCCGFSFDNNLIVFIYAKNESKKGLKYTWNIASRSEDLCKS